MSSNYGIPISLNQYTSIYLHLTVYLNPRFVTVLVKFGQSILFEKLLEEIFGETPYLEEVLVLL